ncbi:MAG: 5'/3'-nucleotidase SurE [Candidatus Thorarchaeota archaeon]
MYRVCLTNDDGPLSDAMLNLADALKEEVELFVVVPDGQRSATGKALTLKRPIRITEKHKRRGYSFVAHDGAPADSVILAEAFYEKLDLVVSGINTGANVGYQSMLTSGTVGAAMEAALRGIPAIAVSQQARPHEWFHTTGNNPCFETVCKVTKQLIMKVLKEGMPERVSVLNLNFPSHVDDHSDLVIVKPTMIRMYNEVEERMDPNGRPYYWYIAHECKPPEGTDAYEVLVRQNIALTPIVIDSITADDIRRLEEFMA